MFSAKTGDSHVVGFKISGEPNETQVVMAGAFEFARGANAIGSSIDQNLQHGARIKLGRTGLMIVNVDAKFIQVDFVDKRIVGADRIVGGNVIFDGRRK